jgi:quercetin dioxygenase-like cupin family protein
MKSFLACLFFVVYLTACSPKVEKERLLIAPGERTSSPNFTGEVRVKFLLPADSINDISVGSVRFEPGARTRWHSHPGGQVLLVFEGTAWYQERGKARQIIQKGELVRCPPDVDHWHGAAKDQAMSHIAIGTQVHRGAVVWKEEVSESEYLGNIRPD